MKPHNDISDLEMAFPTRGLELLPPWDAIPPEYRTAAKQKIPTLWFLKGLSINRVVCKKGVDQKNAFRHMKAIMGCWSPKHEHKMAGIAYLIDQWFEVFDVESR